MKRFWIFFSVVLFSCIVKADFLDNVLVEISGHDNLEARFTDIWKADYLESDVTTQGKLYFKKPDILIKEIVSPEPVKYTVSGNTVKIENGSTLKHINLSEKPDLAMGVNALRMLLQGDRDGLEKFFLIQFRHSDNQFKSWVIELFPRPTYSENNIKKISVSGYNEYIRKFKVDYMNNDVLVTRIKNNE